MRGKSLLLSSVVVCLLLTAAVRAEPTITAFYDKNAQEQKLQFRCIAKGLEDGKKYVMAVGTGTAISVTGAIDVPAGAKVDPEKHSGVEKDIVRIQPALKELKAEGYRLNVHQIPPDGEVKYRFDISYQDMEKLKAANVPIYLYISREFAPNVYYIVDYYEMAPGSLLK